jgi:hypothetical protein
MSWSRAFDDPILLPDGRMLCTLQDAGEHIQELPRATHNRAGVTSQNQAGRFSCSRRARGRIRKSFAFLPDRSCAVSQRGCLPRPDQVSAGFFGCRYLAAR